MRRLAAALLALAIAGDAAAQSGPPPHAWLFGAWTGGLFPAAQHLTAEACLAQPSVVFTRDVVLRASLTDATYVQRVVATARASTGRTDFTFASVPATSGATDPLTGLPTTGSAAQGFGCAGPDELHVARVSANEITFPGCADFPNPLVRCPSR